MLTLLVSVTWLARRLLRSRSRSFAVYRYWTPKLTLCIHVHVAWVMTAGLRRLYSAILTPTHMISVISSAAGVVVPLGTELQRVSTPPIRERSYSLCKRPFDFAPHWQIGPSWASTYSCDYRSPHGATVISMSTFSYLSWTLAVLRCQYGHYFFFGCCRMGRRISGSGRGTD
jgi:hypothetical protein